MRSLDLTKLPQAPYRSRTALVQFELPAINDSTIRFIEEEYPQRELLECALLFAAYSLDEAPPADANSLFRLGFFPWIEASWELDWALTHALCANYKATYDSARRALELSVVAAYFLSSDGSEADAKAWLRSDDQTPFFSRAIDNRLAKTERWAALAALTRWPQPLKEIYWRLSDIVHVRGVKNATMSVQPFYSVIGAHHLACFDATACTAALDTLVETICQMAVVVVLTNPSLIVGLPIDEKFGLNSPASGLLNEVQASRLRSLIPDELRAPLEQLATQDPSARAMVDWVRSRPDLTEAEFQEQADEFNKRNGGSETSTG